MRFSLIVGNEQADAERDGLTCLARPNYQARTGTFFPVQLSTSRIYTLLKVLIIRTQLFEVMTINKYINKNCTIRHEGVGKERRTKNGHSPW